MKECICNRPNLVIKSIDNKYHVQCTSCNRRGESMITFDGAKSNWNGLYNSIRREVNRIGIDRKYFKDIFNDDKTVGNN